MTIKIVFTLQGQTYQHPRLATSYREAAELLRAMREAGFRAKAFKAADSEEAAL